MKIQFTPLDEAAARAVTDWQYPPPYDIYNLENPDELSYLNDPQNNFYRMDNAAGELVGFCSFGIDGQVPGGNYSTPALDIGMGMHPDLTGRGHGAAFISAVLDFSQVTFNPPAHRVTIAAFNQRAQRVWARHGFEQVSAFTFQPINRDFVIMLKPCQ